MISVFTPPSWILWWWKNRELLVDRLFVVGTPGYEDSELEHTKEALQLVDGVPGLGHIINKYEDWLDPATWKLAAEWVNSFNSKYFVLDLEPYFTGDRYLELTYQNLIELDTAMTPLIDALHSSKTVPLVAPGSVYYTHCAALSQISGMIMLNEATYDNIMPAKPESNMIHGYYADHMRDVLFMNTLYHNKYDAWFFFRSEDCPKVFGRNIWYSQKPL